MSSALFFFPKHLLDDSLCTYTRMITSREVQRREPPHSVPADKKILKGSTQSVATVQSSCDVRRRDRNDEGPSGLIVAILCEFWLKEALLRPPGVPTRLDNGGNVRFVVRRVEGSEDCMTRCRFSLEPRLGYKSHVVHGERLTHLSWNLGGSDRHIWVDSLSLWWPSLLWMRLPRRPLAVSLAFLPASSPSRPFASPSPLRKGRC